MDGPRATAHRLHAELVADRPRAVERIKAALTAAGGNASAAATHLGISRRTMVRLLGGDTELRAYVEGLRDAAHAARAGAATTLPAPPPTEDERPAT